MDNIEIILEYIEDDCIEHLQEKDNGKISGSSMELDISIESDSSLEFDVEPQVTTDIYKSTKNCDLELRLNFESKDRLVLVGDTASHHTSSDINMLIPQLRDYGEIYRISNIITKKNYIGQTKCVIKKHGKDVIGGYSARYKDHIHKALKGSTDCPKLYESIRLYGVDKFEIFCCERCNLAELNKREKYYIYKYRARTNGYNSARGGKPRPGKIKFYERMKRKARTF